MAIQIDMSRVKIKKFGGSSNEIGTTNSTLLLVESFTRKYKDYLKYISELRNK